MHRRVHSLEFLQPVFGAIVTGIDYQHIFQADTLLIDVIDQATQPQPGTLVCLIVFENVLENLTSLILSAVLICLDTRVQQLFDVSCHVSFPIC